MGAKRKSNNGNGEGSGKAAKKGDVLAIPAGDLKKQEHLKLFDEWLTIGRICQLVLQLQSLNGIPVSIAVAHLIHRDIVFICACISFSFLWNLPHLRNTVITQDGSLDRYLAKRLDSKDIPEQHHVLDVSAFFASQWCQDKAVDFYTFIEEEFSPEPGVSLTQLSSECIMSSDFNLCI